MDSASTNVTQLILTFGNGYNDALHQLIPLNYGQLNRIARYMRREYPNHTHHTTALVHEAYCKLVDRKVCTGRSRFCNRCSTMATHAEAREEAGMVAVPCMR